MELHVWNLSIIASLLCAAPGVILLAEVVFAKRRVGEAGTSSEEPSPRYRVLIPAHDEAEGLRECLRALMPLLPSPETALVVADNCSDETAAIAESEGAEVLVRDEPTLRGKGYALRHGLEHLAADPPDCVVFLDADTSYLQGTPRDLVDLALATGRPVQGAFQMEVGLEEALLERVSSLAVRIKNDLRVRGLSDIGGVISLLGSNFALPWSACLVVPPPEGELAEDAVWGWRLADRGAPPLYTARAACSGMLARGAEATRIQRARWERGTLLGAWRVLPGVALRALLRGRLGVLCLALDGLVPPLSLLCLACLSCAALVMSLGLSWALAFLPLGLLQTALFVAWLRVGRDLIAPHELIALPVHAAIRVLRLPATLLRGREWKRTPREHTVKE